MPEGSATPASLSLTTTLTPADRHQLVAGFGDHAQAGAMLQPGIQTVSVNGPRGRAFASFTRALGATIVLGEPVGDSEGARADVVSTILDNDRDAIFFQVRPAFAQMLHDGFGLHGTLYLLDLFAQFSLLALLCRDAVVDLLYLCFYEL